MSRSGYVDYDDYDEYDTLRSAGWRANVNRAIAGKKGQAFLWQMYHALEALPEKELITGALVDQDGSCCALGAVAIAKGLEIPEAMKQTDEHGFPDEYDFENLGKLFSIKDMLAREIMHENDERGDKYYVDTGQCIWGTHHRPNAKVRKETPAERYKRMRGWVVKNLKGIP